MITEVIQGNPMFSFFHNPPFFHNYLPLGRRFLNPQKITARAIKTIVNAIPDSPITYLDKDDVSVVSGSKTLDIKIVTSMKKYRWPDTARF